MILESFLTSLIGGGALGVIGNMITSFVNYKMKGQEMSHDIQKMKLEKEIMLAEKEANIQVARAETEGKIAIAEVEALKESYKEAFKPSLESATLNRLLSSKWTAWAGTLISFLFAIADFMTKMARPAITYYLIGASSWVTMLVYQVLVASDQKVITASKAADLFDAIVTTMLFLTVSVVSWWFCDRQTSKFMDKHLSMKGGTNVSWPMSRTR